MTKKEHITIHLKSAYCHALSEDFEQVEFDLLEIGEILGIKANEIAIFRTFEVLCICNTLVEVEENCIGECPNCHRQIDDRGVIQ